MNKPPTQSVWNHSWLYCTSLARLLTGTSKITLSTHPEFYEEEGILRAFSKEFLQATFLFRKLIVYLTDVHRFKQRVTVRMVGMPDVHEEVFVVLQETNGDIPITNAFREQDSPA